MMNKRSGKTNGLAQRLLALLLCCVCLVAIMPVYAIASDAEAAAGNSVTETETATESEKQPADENKIDNTPAETISEDDDKTDSTTSENTEVTEKTNESTTEKTEEGSEKTDAERLYDRIMACETADAYYELIASLTEEERALMDDFPEEQNEALTAKMAELGAYDAELTAQGGSSSSSGGDIDESMYRNTVPVYWDTVTALNTGATSASGANIEKVTLGGVTVTYGNADTTSWSGGTTLATYFPGASANNMTDATMNITATTGYYVTGVVVACAPTGGSSKNTPFKCSTWKSGNEYIENFNLTGSTYSEGKYTLSITINSRSFSHNGKSAPSAYFILITTAKVPTPLYVEYYYGNVASFLTVDEKSAFNNPTWTVANDENRYGSGEKYASGILTKDTQFAYQYPGTDTSVIASWDHKANTVSDAALKEAAAKGYCFAGWAATYYNTCEVTETKDSHNDNYTMNFSSQYGTATYNPGDKVQLPTNVRLVAQWKPIELKMTKIVEGLNNIEEHKSAEQTYTLKLQKQNESGEYEDLQADVKYTIEGDGILTKTFAATGENVVSQAITPGIYRVVETGKYDITGKTENAYCTTTYPVETVVVSENGTVSGDLQVLNTYSSKPAAYNLTIAKTVSGNMADTSKEFTFKVTIDSVDQPTFTLKHGQSTTISVPVGAAVTVTEDHAGYVYSLKAITGITDYTDNKENGITFTMPNADSTVTFNNNKDVSIDTGVTLDSLPYVLILAVVVAGAVIVLRKRRSRDED